MAGLMCDDQISSSSESDEENERFDKFKSEKKPHPSKERAKEGNKRANNWLKGSVAHTYNLATLGKSDDESSQHTRPSTPEELRQLRAQFKSDYGIPSSSDENETQPILRGQSINQPDENEIAKENQHRPSRPRNRHTGPNEFMDPSLEGYRRPPLLPTPDDYPPRPQDGYGAKFKRPLTHYRRQYPPLPPQPNPNFIHGINPNFKTTSPNLWYPMPNVSMPMPDVSRPPPQLEHRQHIPAPLQKDTHNPPKAPFRAPPSHPPTNERPSVPGPLVEGETAEAIHPQHQSQPAHTYRRQQSPSPPPNRRHSPIIWREKSPTPSVVSSASSGEKEIVSHLFQRKGEKPISPGPFRRTPTPTPSSEASTTSQESCAEEYVNGNTHNQRKKIRKKGRVDLKFNRMINGIELTDDENIKEKHNELARCQTKQQRHTQKRKEQRKNTLPILKATASNFDYKSRKAEEKAAKIKNWEEQQKREEHERKVEEAHMHLRLAYEKKEYKEWFLKERVREEEVIENGVVMKKKVKYTMEKELFRLSKEEYNNLEEVVEFNKKLAEKAKEKQAWKRQEIDEKAKKEAEHVRLSTLVRESNFSKEAIKALEEYDLENEIPNFQSKQQLKEMKEEKMNIKSRDDRADLPLEVQRNRYSELRVPKDVNESKRFTANMLKEGPCPDDLQFYRSVGWNTSNPQGLEIITQDGKIQVAYTITLIYIHTHILN